MMSLGLKKSQHAKKDANVNYTKMQSLIKIIEIVRSKNKLIMSKHCLGGPYDRLSS